MTTKYPCIYFVLGKVPEKIYKERKAERECWELGSNFKRDVGI